MKILAIRGKNLASLAGKFEIDFQHEPFATTGLFAIYGPTGSGKSTVLDALCVALFGETPRLSSAPNPKKQVFDQDDITPQDPRNLLRRGCGEGYAMVDFTGKDGIAYRAKWSVRRAHDKATGKLQTATLSLINLDNFQSFVGKNDEVKARIRDRLGLEFEQFRRSVLLAQNEFSVFLRADDNKRAELLETLTGLDICTAISIRAHHRFNDEKAALEKIKQEQGALAPLSQEQRAEYEGQLQVFHNQTTNLEQQHKDFAKYEQWYQQWHKLQVAEQQADAELAKIQAEQHKMQHFRKHLTRVEKVRGARPLIENIRRLEKDISESQRQLNDIQQELHQRQIDYQRVEQQYHNSTAALRHAQNEQEITQPKIEQARFLDKEIEDTTHRSQEYLSQLTNSQNELKRIKKELNMREAKREDLIAKLRIQQEWVTAHEAFKILSERWARWELLLTNALKTQNELHQLLDIIHTKEREQKKAQGNYDQENKKYIEAESAWQSSEIKLKISIRAVAQFDRNILIIQRRNSETLRSQLDEANKLWSTIETTQNRLAQLNQEVYELQEKIQQIKIGLTHNQTEQQFWRPQLVEKELLLKTTIAACAENVEIIRAQLHKGEPCPVCGSCEHPYITAAPTHAFLAILEKEVKDLRDKLNGLREQEIINQTREKNYHERLEKITQEQKEQIIKLDQNTCAWNEQPLAKAFIAQEQITCVGEFLKDQFQIYRKQLIALEEDEKKLFNSQQEEEKAHNLRDDRYRAYLTAEKEKNSAQSNLEQAVNNLKAIREQYAKLTQELVDYLKDLDGAFAYQDWRLLWRADPNNFYEQQRQNKESWDNASRDLTVWGTEIKLIESEINFYQQERLPDKIQQVIDAKNRYQEIQRVLNERRQQRQDLFSGVAVAAIEKDIAQKLASAHQELEKQDRNLKLADKRCTEMEVALEQKQNDLASNNRKLDQANSELNNWIISFNKEHQTESLDANELLDLLASNELEVHQGRARLQELDNQESNQRAIYADRKAQCVAHEQEHPPISEDTVETQLVHIAEELKNAHHQAREIEKILRQDNDRTTKSNELQEKVIAQEKVTTIWNQLKEVIGAHDGKKFRDAAQQYTFGVLVSYANLHLRVFSRRYRLEQIPNSFALLVIDQDMGNARRSVHSLSGGETFLVSLSLSLGLASLSAHQTRVESLFIDEGFGSLDSETLRTAMDALDSLQAQGRKIGIVSHLREITERIAVRVHVHQQPGGRSQIRIYSYAA